MGQAIQRQVSAHEASHSDMSVMPLQDQSWRASRPDLNLSDPQQHDHSSITEDFSPSIILTPALTRNSIQNFNFELENLEVPPQDDLARELVNLGGDSISPANPSLSLFREQPPWNAQHINSFPASSYSTSVSTPAFITNRNTVVRPPINYHGWRQATMSEGRMNPGQQHPPFDHNYLRATRSVISGTETTLDGLPDNASGCGDLVGFTNACTLGQIHPSTNVLSSSNRSDVLSTVHSPSIPDSHRGPSHHKSKKQHRCDVIDCKRNEGFTSSNDLDRHKKAVHGIFPRNGKDRSYRCAAIGCKRSDKIWPRLDNFKNHCKTCHKGEYLPELLKRSELIPEPQPLDANVVDLNNVLESSSSVDAGGFSFADPPPARIPVVDTYALRSNKGKNVIPTTVSGEELARISNQRYDGYSIITGSNTLSTDSSLAVNLGHTDDSIFPSSDLRTAHISTTSDMAIDESIHPDSPPVLSHTFDSNMLYNFSSNLVQEIARVLQLDLASTQQVESVLDRHITDLIGEAILVPTPSSLESASTIITNQNHPPPRRQFSCSEPSCNKTFLRPCELRKHAKRHSRPWVCTFWGCGHQLFGSKADWKRHENTIHFHLEPYKCNETKKLDSMSLSSSSSFASTTTNKNNNNDKKIEECGCEFIRDTTFAAHLQKEHSLSNDAAQRKVHERKRNYPTSYWCGFCGQYLPVDDNSEEGWNERFNHIERHFMAEANMEGWKHEMVTMEKSFATHHRNREHYRIAKRPRQDIDDDQEQTGIKDRNWE